MKKVYEKYEANRIREALVLEKESVLKQIAISDYLQRNLYGNPRYSVRLNRFEYQVYSQNGEDGIIAEVFNRIGTVNRRFLEVGVGDGIECNTAYLLLQGWSGTWVEAKEFYCKYIGFKFKTPRLKVVNGFVTTENINQILDESDDLDLLSIDVDGNDYHIWKALQAKPRVVVIEYNAMFPPDVDWVMPYTPDYAWNGSMCSGASLLALTKLAYEKGYALVGCDFRGVNAFYIQQKSMIKAYVKLNDSPEEATKFYYEPARYFLCTRFGHPRDYPET